MASAPGLVRYAARFTRSLPDAEDAYQRSMEIALTRAPVTEPRRFTAWLHTVIRHEALAIAAARRREAPAAEDDVAASLGEVVGAPPPDALMEWRERYRILQDAVASLTESQRVCLMLKSVGANYAEIATVTGFSLRKVERSILEGRAGLHAWEARMASGGECERLRPALEQAATGAGREVEASAALWARATAEDDDSGAPPTAPRPSTQTPEPPVAERSEDETPAGADTETDDTPDEPLTPPADLSEHRRRLLVAGLTRVRST